MVKYLFRNSFFIELYHEHDVISRKKETWRTKQISFLDLSLSFYFIERRFACNVAWNAATLWIQWELAKQTLFDRFKKAIEQILLTTYIVVSCVPTLERLCKLFETSVRRWTGNIDELKVKKRLFKSEHTRYDDCCRRLIRVIARPFIKHSWLFAKPCLIILLVTIWSNMAKNNVVRKWHTRYMVTHCASDKLICRCN